MDITTTVCSFGMMMIIAIKIRKKNQKMWQKKWIPNYKLIQDKWFKIWMNEWIDEKVEFIHSFSFFIHSNWKIHPTIGCRLFLIFIIFSLFFPFYIYLDIIDDDIPYHIYSNYHSKMITPNNMPEEIKLEKKWSSSDKFKFRTFIVEKNLSKRISRWF